MKNYAKSVLNMSDIRLNRSEVLHQYLPEGNLFRDTVTGLKFSSEGFVELPVSQFNKNTSRLEITLHFDRGVPARATSESVEVFRIGNGDSILFKVEVEKVSATSIKITQIRFELGERIAERSDTFSVTEQVVLLVDRMHFGWNVDVNYTRPSWKFLKTNNLGSLTLGQFNPYAAAALTTEFRGMDFQIVSVEERLVPDAGQPSSIGIAGTSPTFYPLATYSKLDEDDLLLNTYFDEDDTLQVEVGEVIHDGEEALGSITLSEGQSLATTFDHHDNFSLRFISVRESFDSPWFSVTKGDSKTSLYLTEMFSVVLDGVEVGQLQPNSVHTVWLVFVTGRCFVYCNRELVTSFEVLGDGLLKFEAGAGIGRVTGLQAFTNDVRQRNLICHESVTSNRPWWDTHCHLIGFEGFLYDVHNSTGSTERSSPEYIGTSITGTNNSNSVWIDTPFDTYGELIGLHISYSIRGATSVTYQIRFTLDGEDFRLSVQNTTNQYIVLYDSSNKVVKSTTLRANSSNHVNSLSFTTIQVVGDRMYIASGDSVLEVPVKFRKYHSMSHTSLHRYSNSANSTTVEGLIGYTSKAEHALKFPCVTVPSARNLYVPNDNTLLELSGNDLCELVSDEPFEVQLPSKWSLGYSRGNFHEISLTAEHDIVLPFVPATTPEFTMQLQIWEDSLIGGGEPYDKNILVDFGTLKIRVNKGGVGSFCEVILGDHVVTVEPLGFKGWRELILESDGDSVNTYVDGYLASAVPFSEELHLERFNFVAEGLGLQSMKLSALRILNSASAGDILGIGYSAPYSLVLDDSEETVESELTVLKADTIRPSSAREVLLPYPVYDTQANESSAVLRRALESLGGAVEVSQGLIPYAITVPRQDTQSSLDIRQVQASIGYENWEQVRVYPDRSERYCESYYNNAYGQPGNTCKSYGYRYFPRYENQWVNRTSTQNAIAAANSQISNLSAAFPVHNVSAVNFSLGAIARPRNVTITFQARHMQYFTQGEYKVYLLVNGQMRTLAGTIDSRHHHISDPSWRSFSVVMPGDVATYAQHTYTLEFVRTV